MDGAEEINICAVELMKLEIRNSCAGNKKEICSKYLHNICVWATLQIDWKLKFSLAPKIDHTIWELLFHLKTILYQQPTQILILLGTF